MRFIKYDLQLHVLVWCLTLVFLSPNTVFQIFLKVLTFSSRWWSPQTSSMSLTKYLSYKKKRCYDLVASTFFYGVFPCDLPHFSIRKYAWFTFCVFTLSYLCIFTIINIRLSTPFIIKIAIVKTSFSSFMCIFVVLVTYFKRSDIVELIEDIERGFYTYTDESRFKYQFSVSRKTEKKFIGTWVAIILISWAAAVFSQPTILLVRGQFFKKMSRSMLLTYLPWKRDTFFKYYMGHFTLMVFTMSVAATLAGSTKFILNIYFEFRDQFERLEYALNTAVNRTESSEELPKRSPLISSHFEEEVTKLNSNEDWIVTHKITECVCHYRSLVKGLAKIKPWFETVYGMVLVHSLLTLAMMSYAALININDIEVCSFYVYTCLLYIGQLYAFCFTE